MIKPTIDQNFIENDVEISISDELRQRLVELFPNPAFIVNNEGVCLTSNFASCIFLGFDRPEIAGQNIKDFICLDEAEKFDFQSFQQRIKSSNQEWQFKRKDGVKIWGEVYSRRLPSGFWGIVVNDITEIKKANEQLLKEKEFAETTINSLPGIFFLFDESGKFLRWNDNFVRVSGYSNEEISQMRPSDVTADDEKEIVEKTIREIFTTGQSSSENDFLCKDGTRIPYLFTGKRIEIDGVPCTVGMGIDLSQRREAENEVYKLAAIVESSDDAIISKDFDGTILSWNKSAERIFGYTADEIIGQNVHLLFPPDLIDEENDIINKIKAGEHLKNYERVRVRKDGTHFPISLTVSPIKNANDKIIGISKICRDITVEKQTAQAFIESEEQLRQSQKVEAVGRLAGGIAHDFNNFLAVIMLHIDMLNLQLPADSSLRYRVSEIKTVTENAAGMVKQLLAFGRKQTLQPHPIVLNQVVKQFMEVLRPLVGEDIDIQLDLDPDLGVCFVDPNQVNQVLMNLSVNARDAMPKGGKLRIRTENIQLNKGDIRKRKPQPTGAYIQLTVTDTGTGMEPQTQKRIFEPFFTTKEAGKGTGLGLATVYGIIKQSNGFIWVESEQNHGTTFKIQFPRVDQPSTSVKSEGISTFPTGTETILLVEDEEQVRRAAIEVLTVLGYQVFEASNGSQAIQLAKLYKETIHLLLTDVVMPKMNGKEMAEQIKVLHPEATVLYMSGYNDDIIANHGILDENLHFLGKPFSPSTLAHKVREVLEMESEKGK